MKKMSLYSALYEFIGFPFVIEKKYTGNIK